MTSADISGELDFDLDDDSYGDESVFPEREAPTLGECPTCHGTGRVLRAPLAQDDEANRQKG